MKVSAKDVLRLLLNKHCQKFVCVPECKTGSTWGIGGCPTLDLWVMACSWANPRTIGYEIKVSRSDFLGDHKWRGYLPYCSEFYFAAPPGIIDPLELPAEAGLLVTSKNVKCLYTKKKAPARDVVVPESLYMYILMSRAEITREYAVDNASYWRDWLTKRDEDKDLGRVVSETIGRVVRERIEKVEQENRALNRQNERLQDIKVLAAKLGIDINDWSWRDQLEVRLTGVNRQIRVGVDRAITTLTDIRAQIDSANP